jgi:histidinol-phosphate aminotransferase
MMNQLARENILTLKPYLPGKPIEEVRRELGIKGSIIKLASNENPLGPSPRAVKALKHLVNTLNLYPDDNCYYLIRALVDKLKIKPDELILGNGSVEILDLITKAFVNPGDEVVMAEYSFIMYPIVTTIANGKRKAIPLKDSKHNLRAMAEAITQKTKVVFIANPNNPTGTMNTAEEMDYFMSRIPDNVLIVLDEAYREYITRQDFPDSFRYLREERNVIILRTFSKIYGLAGLRLGYGIANPGIIEALRKVRLPFNINSAAQAAGIAALGDESHVKRSININEEGKNFLYNKFDEIGLTYVHTEANFIFTQPPIDGKIFSNELMKQGIIVRYLAEQDSRLLERSELSANYSRQYSAKAELPHYNLQSYQGVRITIGTKPQNQRLIKAIKEVLHKHRQNRCV